MAPLHYYFIAAMVALMACLVNSFVISTYSSRKIQRSPKTEPALTQTRLFFDNSSEKGNDGTSPSSTSDKELVPLITKVGEVQDFLDFLGEDERLCVVKFHAKWCKSCQKFGVKFHHLALEEADKFDPVDRKITEKGRVRFADVEFTANAKLCRSMGIKRLPYVHFYKACAGRLTHFSCGPAKFQKVVDKMDEYLGMSDEEIKFAVTMEEGQSLGDELATTLKEQRHEETLQNQNTDASSTSDP